MERRYGRLISAGVAVAGVLLTAACGGGSGGDDPGDAASPGSGSGSSPGATASSPAPAKPMAKMPAGTDAGLLHKGRLTVCKAGSPPFFRAADGNTTRTEGFDIDVLNMVGERIGAVPDISGYDDSRQMLEGTPLNKGVCDVIAGFSPDDPKYFPKMSFSSPFFTQDSAILAKKGTHYTSPAALAGKHVVAQPGDREALGADASRMQLDTNLPLAAQLTEVRTGRVDAMVTTNAYAMNVLAEHPEYGLEIGGDFGGKWYSRLAVKKGNTALLKQIDAALKDAGGNGRYAKAYREWFGEEPPSLPKGE